jgi:formylglycine-generating enzyme required for sulfatase activity
MRHLVSSVAFVAVLMALGCHSREKGGAMSGQPDDSGAKAAKEDSPGEKSDAGEKATTAAEKTIASKVAGKEQPSSPDSAGQKKPAVALKSITNSIGMTLALIPAGEFLMGSLDSDKGAFDREKPQHRVRITKPFYLGVYPVTQAEYGRVMGENPSWFCKSGRKQDKIGKEDTSQFPVENVSWEDAVEFCKRLSEKEMREYGLPTEAQWEYACRAGSKTRYSFGDDENLLGEYAWFVLNSGGRPHPVGRKQPNAWGLYDMHGNLWEWCQDWYGEYQANSPADDPTGPTTGSYRVFRGGSWCLPARNCRSADRYGSAPGSLAEDLGFRVSLVPADK